MEVAHENPHPEEYFAPKEPGRAMVGLVGAMAKSNRVGDSEYGVEDSTSVVVVVQLRRSEEMDDIGKRG